MEEEVKSSKAEFGMYPEKAGQITQKELEEQTTIENPEQKPSEIPVETPAQVSEIDTEKVPKKRNILIMFIFSVITLGIYPSIWYVKRADELNNLGTQKKIGSTLLLMPLVFDILFLCLIVVIPLTITLSVEEMGEFFQNMTPLQIGLIFSLGVVILLRIFFYFLLAFYSRTIINQALESKGSQKKISGFFTIIFTILYLQYEINKILDDKENEPRIGPWMFFAIFAVLMIIGVIYLVA